MLVFNFGGQHGGGQREEEELGAGNSIWDLSLSTMEFAAVLRRPRWRSKADLHHHFTFSSGQMATMLFPPSLDANREPDQLLRYHGVFFRRASLREVELWWSRQPSGFVPGVALIVSVWELCWT